MSRQGFRHGLLIAVLAQFVTVAVAQDSAWIGRKFMPKEGSKLMVGNREVPSDLLALPYTVTKVNGEWLWIGRAWIKKSEVVALEDAEAYYTQYLRNHAKSAAVYTNRGIVWEQKGDLEKALTDFNDAIRIDPKYARAYYGRGVTWYMKADFDNAFKDYSEAIRLRPNYAPAFHGRGNVWLAKGQFDSAFKDFTEAIRLDPNYAPAYLDRSQLWTLLKHDSGNAVKDYTELIRLDPTHAHAYYDRGMLWLTKGEVDKALADFAEAIRLEPQNAGMYVNRGTIFFNNGKLDNALSDYNEAIRIGPKDEHLHASAYNGRGFVFEKKGEFDNALKDHTEATRIDPRDFTAYIRLAWIMATAFDAKYRDGMRAVELATKACDLSPWEDAINLDTLACAHAEAGDFEKAVEWQTKALQMLKADNVPDKDVKMYEDRLALFKSGKAYHGAKK